MKIMTQDKTRVLNFKMTYISYVSKNRICEGDFSKVCSRRKSVYHAGGVTSER